jgi:protein involved in polysaccharide export with SLBB domain
MFTSCRALAQAAPELVAPAKSPQKTPGKSDQSMKIPGISAFVLVAALATTTSGQVKSVAAANKQPDSKPAGTSQSPAGATRARTFGQEPKTPASTENVGTDKLQSRARPGFNNHTETPKTRSVDANSAATLNGSAPGARTLQIASASPGHTSLRPAVSTVSNFSKATGATALISSTAPSVNVAAAATSTSVTAATNVYRVGVRDVLDIQLKDNSSRDSTLFTVLDGGLLEYPFAGGAIPVAGLTTGEIATLLRQRIKIFDNPAVTVNVRDYASHAVTVSGFVAAPGTKTLRREAVPLYTLLAEALILPEAARATITRSGHAPIVVDLKDANLSATPVVPGDAIKVSGLPAGPTEFFFIGGQINSPGQKPYSAGLTLTQAILASGGASASAGSKVRVSRQGANGLLVAEDYNLRKILNGKLPDPVLQKGDRIEVTDSN